MKTWGWLTRMRQRLVRPTPPEIMTEWGPVTEAARRQAAENIRSDAKLRARIVDMLGEAEARRRYPEGFVD